MAVMDKVLSFMNLNAEEDEDIRDFYDDEEDMDDEYEYDEYEPPKKRGFRHFTKNEFSDRRSSKERDRESAPEPKFSSKITPMRQTSRSAQRGGAAMEVCITRPSNVDDAKDIINTLMAGRTVVINLEGLDLDIAQRITDILAGGSVAIKGNFQRISNYIFIVTPACVDISGDLQSLMDSFDSSAIQTDI